MREYLEHFATRLGLHSDIQFNSRVSALQWDEEGQFWDVTVDGHPNVRARHVVLGTGLLQQPVYPNIAGLESFKGDLVHTSSWPQEGMDLSNKRVGVIGVGSSSVQLIPQIAMESDSVTVFQRTPNYVVPTFPRALSDAEREENRLSQHEIFERCSNNPFGVDLDGEAAPYDSLTEEERYAALNRNWGMGGFCMAWKRFSEDQRNQTGP